MANFGTMLVSQKGRGGALPTADNSGYSVPAPGARASGRLDDSGVQLTKRAGQIVGEAAQLRDKSVAGAVGDVFGAASKLGFALYDMGVELDKTRAQEAFAQYQLEGQEERMRLSQLRGSDALGSADGKTPDVQTQMSQWESKARERYMRNLGEFGRHYFNTHADKFAMEQQGWAQKHQLSEFESYRQQEIKTAIAVEGRNVALDPDNAAAVARSLGRIRGLIEQQGQYYGWSPEMVAEEFRQTQAGLIGNAIKTQMTVGDYGKAQALYDRHKGVLDPATSADIGKALAQEAALRAYEGNPLAGSVDLMTKAGRERFGLSREAGAAVARQLSALAAYQKKAARAGYRTLQRQEWDEINQEQDPVRRVRRIQNSRTLSTRDKQRILQADEQGIPVERQADIGTTNDMFMQMMGGEEVSKDAMDNAQARRRLNPATRKFLTTAQEILADDVYGDQWRKGVQILDGMMDAATDGMPPEDAARAKFKARNAFAAWHKRAAGHKELDEFYKPETLPQVLAVVAESSAPTVQDRVNRLEQQARQEAQRRKEERMPPANTGTAPGVAGEESAPAPKPRPKTKEPPTRRALQPLANMVDEQIQQENRGQEQTEADRWEEEYVY